MAKAKRPARNIDWTEIKKRWEADITVTFKSISEELGGKPSKQAIGQRAKRESWTRVDVSSPDDQEAIEAAADKESAKREQPKPADQPSPGEALTPAKADAIEMRGKVLDRHRREINLPRQKLFEAVTANDFNKAKLAKISAETLSIIQSAERKAWGLDGDQKIVFQFIPPSPRDKHD